jgi:hypothetical protein
MILQTLFEKMIKRGSVCNHDMITNSTAISFDPTDEAQAALAR